MKMSVRPDMQARVGTGPSGCTCLLVGMFKASDRQGSVWLVGRCVVCGRTLYSVYVY